MGVPLVNRTFTFLTQAYEYPSLNLPIFRSRARRLCSKRSLSSRSEERAQGVRASKIPSEKCISLQLT